MIKKKRTVSKPKKRGKKKQSLRTRKIDIEQILLQRRQVFLFGVINDKLTTDVIKKLIALDRINHNPIALYINSPGGAISSGFSIIDIMKGIRSPIITFIVGNACSMAGIISVAGTQRLMSKHATWMAHDGSAYTPGKFTDVIDFADYIKTLQKRVFQFLRDHTKLSEAEIAKARRGQLWLTPKDCKEKGVVDFIVGEDKVNVKKN